MSAIGMSPDPRFKDIFANQMIGIDLGCANTVSPSTETRETNLIRSLQSLETVVLILCSMRPQTEQLRTFHLYDSC